MELFVVPGTEKNGDLLEKVAVFVLIHPLFVPILGWDSFVSIVSKIEFPHCDSDFLLDLGVRSDPYSLAAHGRSPHPELGQSRTLYSLRWLGILDGTVDWHR